MTNSIPTFPYSHEDLTMYFTQKVARKVLDGSPFLPSLAHRVDRAVTTTMTLAYLAEAMHLGHDMIELNALIAFAVHNCGVHDPEEHKLAAYTINYFSDRYDPAMHKVSVDTPAGDARTELRKFLDLIEGLIATPDVISWERYYADPYFHEVELERSRLGWQDVVVFAVRAPEPDNTIILGRSREEVLERVKHAFPEKTLTPSTLKHIMRVKGLPPRPIAPIAYPADLRGTADELAGLGGAPVAHAEGSGIPAADNPVAPANPYDPIDPDHPSPQVNDIADFMPRRETYGGGVKSE